MMSLKLLGSLALATLAASAAAQPADFTAQADSLVQAAYRADGPGAAVVVTRRGQVVYSAGRGLADVEEQKAITADTPFRLGSIVKQFTAAVVLQLADEGKISLDDPVSRFFPDWPEPAARATVRQLLNHTSGIQDFSKVPGWIAANRPKAWTTAELLALFRTLPARSKPGEAWEYNNGGYVMLGAIVEKVTGKAWHEAVDERIARPLGLGTIAHAASDRALRTMARGYSEEGGRQVPLETVPVTVAHASGGLVGSVRDVARWAQALHHGRVVGPAWYQEMIRPARLADGTTRPYGFGLRLQQLRGRPAFAHGGAGAGLDTDSLYLPAEDLFVAVFANSDSPATDPGILTRRLAALALGEPFPALGRVEVDMAAIEPLFGLYSAETGPPLRFFARGGKLFVGMGEGELEAFPAGDDRFFFGPDRLIWVRFERKPGGAHVALVDRPDEAKPLRAVRSGPAPPAFTVAPEVLRTYVGTYRTEALAVTIALGADGSLTITPAGQRPMRMRPVSETEFRIDGTPMRLIFHPENGRVDRLTLYRGARELHGRRTGS
jgi:CubicO group peptidase (beta-lactamase class C family)